jgi:drug/metabolite transporter (DMT)-like permease
VSLASADADENSTDARRPANAALTDRYAMPTVSPVNPTINRTPASPAGRHPLIGVAFKIASTFGFTAMTTLIKLVGPGFPIGEVVFCRAIFALIPLSIWIVFTDGFGTVFRTSTITGHLKRSIAGSCAIYLTFGALYFLPVADATAIGYAMPLIATVLAVVVLGEHVQRYRWIAVGAGFVGVLVILSSYLGGFARGSAAGIGALMALAGAFATALAFTQIRVLARGERTATIVIYFTLFSALAGLVTLPLGWLTLTGAWILPAPLAAAGLVAIGICGGFAQVMITQSYHYSDASLVAPFEYTSMLWALAASWLVFGVWPDATVLVGAAIVIAAGLGVIYREHRVRRAIAVALAAD